ncbi:CinA family protein [Pedobacter mucosus]|uniref:CinA family protein n=1 Tax=Pedobacter mucosus TaxID=2895286 RepID=UPI001EE46B4C|nr:CinA family protein [Pedobacter mucosus]UKT64223.1 CinA family protein [Pedobacter mucosus]
MHRGSSIGFKLNEQKLTIAFAESATAGHLCADFSLMENAGSFLKGGIICYDAEIKESLLEVDPQLIAKFSPESMEGTREIALGLSKIIPADIHVGITGLTCPGGSESTEKPVGTMFIYACKNSQHIFSERITFSGNKLDIVLATANHFACMLENYLDKES